MSDSAFDAIIAEVKARALRLEPGLSFVPKYGGEVFVPDPDTPKAFVGGIFVYRDHVSVEFSNGAQFDDPKGHLSGKGKLRRHLKLVTLSDLDRQGLDDFLVQALA